MNQTSTTPAIENTTTTTYNGWTNYATWRVNLEIVADYMNAMEDDNRYESVIALADDLQYITTDILDNQTGVGLAYEYAIAFIGQVNWYEIAETYVSDNPKLLA